MNRAILLISCPDQKGITASVTNFIYTHNGNIVHADQHIDEQTNTFFMRIEWSMDGFSIAKENVWQELSSLVVKFNMKCHLSFSDETPQIAVFASKHLHCLHDLLYRHRAGQLSCDIALIVSNHSDAKSLAKTFGIKFLEFSITKENKHEQEKKHLEELKRQKIDLIVLARYHQILSAEFVSQFVNRIINIHHSFLPAFVGSSPYLQAYQRGVKIIGATSHYVTEQLDQGPIIDQDTVRVSHRDILEDLIRKGEDLERLVLSRAVRWHLERKILSYENKTVVFD